MNSWKSISKTIQKNLVIERRFRIFCGPVFRSHCFLMSYGWTDFDQYLSRWVNVSWKSYSIFSAPVFTITNMMMITYHVCSEYFDLMIFETSTSLMIFESFWIERVRLFGMIRSLIKSVLWKWKADQFLDNHILIYTTIFFSSCFCWVVSSLNFFIISVVISYQIVSVIEKKSDFNSTHFFHHRVSVLSLRISFNRIMILFMTLKFSSQTCFFSMYHDYNYVILGKNFAHFLSIVITRSSNVKTNYIDRVGLFFFIILSMINSTSDKVNNFIC